MTISAGTFLVTATMLLAPHAGAISEMETIVDLVPERPIAGSELRITYHPGRSEAGLDDGEEIYAVLSIQKSDHSRGTRIAVMQRGESGALTHSLILPDAAAFLTVSFTTLHANDGGATLGVMVYVDDETPARTAWERSVLHPSLQQDYAERIARELDLHPDNLAAYRTKWFVAGAYDKDKQDSIVEKDMRRIVKKAPEETVDSLYALSYGNLLLGREKEGRALVRRLVELFPDAALTASAIQDYEYFAYAQQYQGEGTEQIKDLAVNIAARFPDSQLARDRAGWFASDEEFPLEVMEAICRSWIDDQPSNPLPRFHLAKVYSDRKVGLDEAAALAERALEGILSGRLRLYQDPSGSMADLYLAAAYRLATRIEIGRERFGAALAFAKTAGSFGEITSAESYLLEGEVRTRLKNPGAAEAAYLEAWRRGSKEAEEALRTLFRRRHDGIDGFEEYLEKHKGGPAGGAGMRPPAPRFAAVSLDGREFDSSALAGKVVVLNFWFVGCAPCRIEIPDLNRLAERFATDEVVFLAFALDTEEALRSFLEEQEFAYHVIPDAGQIIAEIGIDSYPTHMIISKNGETAARLMGGGPDRAEELGRLIDQALAE